MLNTVKTEKIPVCAYCRVSTREDSQLNSLENQTYYFNEKTEKNEKYDLYHIYADEGLTATSWKKRKYFQDMLYDAGLDIEIHRREIKSYVSNRVPKFKRILVKDVSRFSRNASEGLELVTKLREKNVHIDFVSLGITTEQMTNDMIIGFFLLAAENESKDRSVKVLWGKKISAEKGRINTSDKFFGYKYIKEINSLEIIEHEAEIVRKVYDLYVNHNQGFRLIMKYLNENKMHTRRGKEFTQTSVKRMLENPAYKGVLARNRMDAPLVFSSKTYATVRPEEEWIITEGRIPKIVEPELFDMAQEIRKSKVNYKNRVGIYKGISEYAGKIVCGECGSVYIKNVEPRNGRGYYACKTKKIFSKTACSNVNIFMYQIETVMDDLSQEGYYEGVIKDRDDYIRKVNDKISELKTKLDKQNIEEVDVLKKQRDELYEENRRVGLLFAKGNIKEADLDEMQKDVDERISSINKEIAAKSMDNEQIYGRIKELNKCIEELKELTKKESYSKEEIKKQILQIEISRDPDYLHKPYNKQKPWAEVKFKISNVMKNIAEKYYD